MGLKEYNQKRDFSKTKEPKGKKESSSKKRIFVVQHHAARKDHYDFRLELDGVLLSFAVPKGPSYNQKDKRLAVHVEDHPLTYANFEGTIPKGEYGGGTVMLWDKGTWEPLGSPKKDLKEGSIKFVLYGTRLQGKWTLVHFKEDNWLLIKEKDGVMIYQNIQEFPRSIKTDRTMEEIANGIKKVKDSKALSLFSYVPITNPDKVLFSKPKVTKMDCLTYYKKVLPRMLPFLQGRLMSVVRAPSGVEEETFFKKHFENAFLGRINITNKEGKKNDSYYILDEKSVLSEVQMNSIEFHIWGSSIANLNHPNMMVFDLDPDEAMPLKKVREGVKDLKEILDEFHLTSFLKTSGGKGYHVVVPIQKLKNWKQFREVAKTIAELMEARYPDKYVSNMRKDLRKGKIFIDWVRNTKGATSVAPYSIRARNGARISMPISWSELDKIAPDEITMEMALKRLKRKNPWEGFFEVDQ